MNRRSWMATVMGVALGALGGGAARPAEPEKSSVLYTDFVVDPANEQAMLDFFHSKLKPIAERHDGYIDLKLLKMKPVGGAPPAPGIAYRYQLTYENETKRHAWVASDDHKANWPLFAALFHDVVNRVGEVS
ncbi:MAG TPA: hypothetical protein VMU59_12690 [Caulobacteraceae bacterium]|nr:hypothetical protein [Caulobacteraceae bacterium]